MTGIQVKLIPAAVWEGPPLGTWAEDALACEQRRRDGAALGSDEVQYAKLCGLMERFGLEYTGAGVQLPDGYVSHLQDLEREPGDRLLATFFPPAQLTEHVIKLRAKGVPKAFIQPFMNGSSDGAIVFPDQLGTPKRARANRRAAESKSPAKGTIDDAAMREVSTNPRSALVLAFQHAGSDPVNVAYHRNDDITEAMHAVAYGDAKRQVRVRLPDGSVTPPFSIGGLQRNPRGQSQELKFALLSHRHLEMDAEVDAAWFRNRRVSTGGIHADQENYCFESSLERFQSYKGEPLDIQLYQTGHVPAVVGFYRAVNAYLRGGGETALSFSPRYLEGETYEPGSQWT